MNIIPFQSPDFSIRAVEIDGEPWFVGKDVDEALGYINPADAISKHCKGVAKRYPLGTVGGTQKVRFINEPDLFRLAVNSKLPSAEKFERWVFEEVLPAIRKTGQYQAKPEISPIKQTSEAAKAFNVVFRTMRLIGCDENAAAISANQAIRNVSGVDLLALSGNTHLIATNQQSLYHTPTELGQMMGGVPARQVNLLLAGAGLQARVGEYWQPLEAGQEFARLYDTGKCHGNGTPIQQIKWVDAVLPLLQNEIVA